MGTPVATGAHTVVAVDVHIVLVPSPGGPVPTPLPHPFQGRLDGGLVPAVKVGGQPVAVVGSTASNQPHVPTPPGTGFQRPPADLGTVKIGSVTVKVCGKGIARAGDVTETCNDPANPPVGRIVAAGTVTAG